MLYNNLIVEDASGNPSKEPTMSIITVVNGSSSDSHLVNDHGSTIAALNEKTKQQLLKQGVPEKVVRVKDSK